MIGAWKKVPWSLQQLVLVTLRKWYNKLLQIVTSFVLFWKLHRLSRWCWPSWLQVQILVLYPLYWIPVRCRWNEKGVDTDTLPDRYKTSRSGFKGWWSREIWDSRFQVRLLLYWFVSSTAKNLCYYESDKKIKYFTPFNVLTNLIMKLMNGVEFQIIS